MSNSDNGEPALKRDLPDEIATAMLGEDIAAVLKIGDVIALKGDLGAGKTTLARGLIRAVSGNPDLEVPSPTFTLVQAYETRIPLSHFDLYRLSGPDELGELGLDEAVLAGAAIVEWPEKAQGWLPQITMTVSLRDAGRARIATISGRDEALARLARSFEIRDFLDRSGWQDAVRTYLSGDASARTYETVALPDRPARILMNSPQLDFGPPVSDGKPYGEIAHTARSVSAFVGVARSLREAGVTVPEIFAQDLERGFLLIEHLGSGGFLSNQGAPIADRYEAAARLLAFMHARSWPDRIDIGNGTTHVIPPFDRDAMMIEIELLTEWYMPAVRGRPTGDASRREFRSVWNKVLDRLADAETSIVLRDFHSPNIIWREDRSGNDRLGVIDFQDALIGPSAYDVASLALDARASVSPVVEAGTVEAYVTARDRAGRFDRASFDAAYSIMGAQRNSKILGIFVRLDRRDGKPHYVRHLPRIREYLRRALRHSALDEVREFYESNGLLEEHTA